MRGTQVCEKRVDRDRAAARPASTPASSRPSPVVFGRAAGGEQDLVGVAACLAVEQRRRVMPRVGSSMRATIGSRRRIRMPRCASSSVERIADVVVEAAQDLVAAVEQRDLGAQAARRRRRTRRAM